MNLLDGLVEFWTFNDTLVGLNGHTLASADGLPHFVAGKIGYGWEMYGDGRSALSCVLSALSPQATGLTIALWTRQVPVGYFYPTTTGIASLNDGTTSERCEILGRKTGDKIAVAARVISGGTSTVQAAETSLAVPMDSWRLIGCSYAPDLLTARMDLFKAARVQSAPIPTSVSQLTIGAVPALTGKLIGVQDSIGVWSRVLSDEDWSALYAAGLGWEPSAQTIKQHLIVSPSGIIQPVGSSIVVPGWV